MTSESAPNDRAPNAALDDDVRSGRALKASMGDFHVKGWDPARRVLEAGFTVRPEYCHSGGKVAQGGFITAWLDAAMAHAVIHDTDHTQTVFSLEIKVTFYEKVAPGDGRVEGRVIKRGRRVVFLEGMLYNGDGVLAAQASSTGVLAPL